MSAIFHSGT